MTSTTNLSARLARLEAAQAAGAGSKPLPPELVQVCLRAVAIALGGFPRPRQPAPSYQQDSFSDGFARGLGYTDRADMEARSEANPDDWRERTERAHIALCERYKADGCPDPAERGRVVLVAALDEWAAAKSSGPDWPADDDSDTLARAVIFYGSRPEATEART